MGGGQTLTRGGGRRVEKSDAVFQKNFEHNPGLFQVNTHEISHIK